MIDISISYSDKKDLDSLYSIENEEFYIEEFDSLSKKSKSDAWKLKKAWSARLDPFIKVSENGDVIRCFYSETGINAVTQLKEWLIKRKTEVKPTKIKI